jgi:Domain of unknown function DUF1828/Domain of unknown function DUF1829
MTDVAEISRLVDEYRSWLKDRITLKSVHEEWVEISTPFLDRHNDYIQLYVKKENGGYQITDDGNTIRDLEMSGCMLDTPKRQSLLKVTLGGFSVEEQKGILFVRATPDNFGARKHAIIQAILAINDMFYLASSTVHSLFKEDVEKWLERSEIRFLPNIQFVGRSGYVHHFDFAIPQSRQAPERIIRAIGNPNKDAALSYITAWTETVEQRPDDAEAFAFLNDNERVVGAAVLDALRKYEINPVLWSDRVSHRQRLTA